MENIAHDKNWTGGHPPHVLSGIHSLERLKIILVVYYKWKKQLTFLKELVFLVGIAIS